MKKTWIALTLLVLLGCANTVDGSASADIQRENDAWVNQRAERAVECGAAHAAEVDDGISDALTVALALSYRCDSEYRMVMEAMAVTQLNNQTQVRMFQQRTQSSKYRSEWFLPAVMRYRNTVRQSRKQ